MLPERATGYRADNTLFFDTDAFPISYAPEAELLSVTGQTITFPDFRKGWAYCWQQWDGSGGNPRESAISVVTIGAQEWGPASMVPPATVNLDETVVGVVPSAADHIRVRTKLSRTTSPSQINGNTIPVAFKEGEWVEVADGALLVEYLYPIARMLTFYLSSADNGDGTRNVIMRRTMSTVNQFQSFYQSANNPNQEGWIYGGTYGSRSGIPVSQIAVRPANTDVTGLGGRYRQNGSSPASTTDTTNYQSVYTGDIEILAGYAGIDPTYGGSDPNGPYVQYLGQLRTTTPDLTTFSSWSSTPQLGVANATRKIILLVMAENDSTADRSIATVKVGSTLATQIFQRQGDNGSLTTAAGMFIVEYPTGTTDTVEVVMNATSKACSVLMFAGYNMASSTPDATISSATLNSSASLTTYAGQGFAIAAEVLPYSYGNIISFNADRAANSLAGIENVFMDSVGYNCLFSRGFQSTGGETLSMQAKSNVVSASGATNWIAASFH